MSTSIDETKNELARLLDEAMKQPGVADLMAAFDVWREVEQVSNVQRMYDEEQFRVSLSNVTTPLAGYHF